MNRQTENRRVRMTKRLMKDALLELLEQTDLSSVSVTAVCNAADVHRSTFYKYYSCPSDLLQEIEQEVLDRIPAPMMEQNQHGEKNTLMAMTDFLDYVKGNEQVFRILFSESVNSGFASRLVELLSSRYFTEMEEENALSSRYLRLYIISGVVGMLREWMNDGFPGSSRKIAEMMRAFSVKLTR